MDLQLIHVQLGRLLGTIEQELTKLLSSASFPLASSAAYDRVWHSIDSWEEQLNLIGRNLSSEMQRLELESGRISSLPRDARYSMQQSLADRGRNLNDAMAAVGKVRERLDLLLDRLGRPTGPEIIKALEKLTTGTYKQAELMQAASRELHALSSTTSVSSIRGPAPSAGPDLLVSIAVIGRMLQIVALHLAGGSGRGTAPSR